MKKATGASHFCKSTWRLEIAAIKPKSAFADCLKTRAGGFSLYSPRLIVCGQLCNFGMLPKATPLTVTVLAIATLAGTSVAQSAYSKALTSGHRTALFSPDGQMLAIPTVAGIPIWQAFGN
jgi:hypothetical protein